MRCQQFATSPLHTLRQRSRNQTTFRVRSKTGFVNWSRKPNRKLASRELTNRASLRPRHQCRNYDTLRLYTFSVKYSKVVIYVVIQVRPLNLCRNLCRSPNPITCRVLRNTAMRNTATHSQKLSPLVVTHAAKRSAVPRLHTGPTLLHFVP